MIAAMGTITRDIIEKGGLRTTRLGGAPFFFSQVCSRLGVSHIVISHISRSDAQQVSSRTGLIRGDRTTELLIRETSEDTSCEVVLFTGKISPRHLSLDKVRLCLVSPFFDEVHPADVAKENPGLVIALDIQGFTRKKSRFLSDLTKTIPKDLASLLVHVSILKLNDLESRIICGDIPIRDRFLHLSAYGPKTILITRGVQGTAIFDRGEMMNILPEKIALGSSVGAGDIFFSAFLAFLEKGFGVKIAAAKAGAVTGVFLEENWKL